MFYKPVFEGIDYFVRYIELPMSICGSVITNGDNTFDIYINSLHPLDIQRQTYYHEVAHIVLGHHYDDTHSHEAKDIEAEAFIPTLRDLMKEWTLQDQS